MRQKAIMFPCDQEALSIMRNSDICEYDIKYYATLKGFDTYFKEIEDNHIGEYSSDKLKDVDCIIIMETRSLISFEDIIYPVVSEAVKLGKDIVLAKQLEDKELEKCKQLCEANRVQLDILTNNISISMIESIKEENVEVPVVYIAGVSIYTEKFDVQMAIRKKFISTGYAVSQIGSRRNCELLGFHSFPQFMDDDMDTAKKIVLYKKYIKYIEVSENPEIIVIGIPGGIMPVSHKHHFDFGLTTFAIANAVHPDYVIMNLFYKADYIEKQLDEFSKVCYGKYNFEIDSFHISSTFIEPSSLNDRDLKYIVVENKEFHHNVSNLWDIVSEDDAEKAFKHIVDKLSSYNINEI